MVKVRGKASSYNYLYYMLYFLACPEITEENGWLFADDFQIRLRVLFFFFFFLHNAETYGIKSKIAHASVAKGLSQLFRKTRPAQQSANSERLQVKNTCFCSFDSNFVEYFFSIYDKSNFKCHTKN